MEPLLWKCILQWAFLFSKNSVIIDAGANDGTSTLLLSSYFKNHTIFSVEPILVNIANILRKTKKINNIIVQHGGLGDQMTYGTYPRYLDQKKSVAYLQIGKLKSYRHLKQGDVKFPVFTIDYLFQKHKLSFAHWDVEGNEIELLNGAQNVIKRDRPFFTVESFHLSNASHHHTLMSAIKHLNYTIIRVNEKCGWPRDCRNYLCVPNEHFKKNLCDNTTTMI